MATLLSLAAGSLVLLLILVCFTVYAMRREKCCFARKYTSLRQLMRRRFTSVSHISLCAFVPDGHESLCKVRTDVGQ
jgi:hypothetical protein